MKAFLSAHLPGTLFFIVVLLLFLTVSFLIVVCGQGVLGNACLLLFSLFLEACHKNFCGLKGYAALQWNSFPTKK